MLDINKLILWGVSALACLSVLAGGFFYVRHLQSEVRVLTDRAEVYAQAARDNDETIKRYEKDKVFDEKLLSDLSQQKQEIRKNADERKAKVARQPDGATPPAIVCAIVGLC